MVRLARADIVLTTYSIVGKEVGVPEGQKGNKQFQDMPVHDDKVPDLTSPLYRLRSLSISRDRLVFSYFEHPRLLKKN